MDKAQLRWAGGILRAELPWGTCKPEVVVGLVPTHSAHTGE